MAWHRQQRGWTLVPFAWSVDYLSILWPWNNTDFTLKSQTPIHADLYCGTKLGHHVWERLLFWLLATVVCTDTQFYTTEQRMYSLYLHIQSKLKSKTCLSLISSSQHLHNLFHLQIHCTRKATSSRLKGPSDRCWPAVNMQEMSDTGHEDDSLLVKYLARFNRKVALVLK